MSQEDIERIVQYWADSFQIEVSVETLLVLVSTINSRFKEYKKLCSEPF